MQKKLHPQVVCVGEQSKSLQKMDEISGRKSQRSSSAEVICLGHALTLHVLGLSASVLLSIHSALLARSLALNLLQITSMRREYHTPRARSAAQHIHCVLRVVLTGSRTPSSHRQSHPTQSTVKEPKRTSKKTTLDASLTKCQNQEGTATPTIAKLSPHQLSHL